MKGDYGYKIEEHQIPSNAIVKGVMYTCFCKNCRKIVKTYSILTEDIHSKDEIKKILTQALNNREKYFLDSLKDYYDYILNDEFFIIINKKNIPIITESFDENYSDEEKIHYVKKKIDDLIQENCEDFYENVINENILETIEFSSEDIYKNWRFREAHCPQCDSDILHFIWQITCPKCGAEVVLDYDIIT